MMFPIKMLFSVKVDWLMHGPSFVIGHGLVAILFD
jgi:hypothetical protein